MKALLYLLHNKSLWIVILLLVSNLIFSNNLDENADTICTKDKLYTYDFEYMTANRYK